ncbi:hypothetical protein NIES4102_28920 [Chondrocystis sp. NIES-4102]|nr:hypothetical protein NIES4102_28920 [Chondrocystis sp. NIES-4102]
MQDVSFISSSNGIETMGSAGNININVQSLEISENAFINAFTNNNFNAGVITINAQTLDLFSGGKIIAATDGGGNAGNIAINMSGELKIDSSTKYSDQTVDFAGISPLLNDLQQSPSGIYADATAKARGSGGNILINSDSIFLNNDAIISASTSFGEGGNIILKLNNDLTLDNNSTISARAFNQASGGNVNIDSRFIIAFLNGNNDIIASAAEGAGGYININAESLFGIEKRQLNPLTNDINASSNVIGLDGTVTINTPDLYPLQRVIELTNNIIEPGQTTEQACQANREAAAKNELTIKGKGGVPTAPAQPLISQHTHINGEIDVASATIEPIKTSVGKIQLARGMTVKENGQVILTAYPTNNAGERIPQVKINCGQI